MDVTARERREMRRYRQLGYTVCVLHGDGGVVPGYHDFMLEIVLDERDADIALHRLLTVEDDAAESASVSQAD